MPNILGGIETHCEELYPRLADLGCDVTVVRRKSFVKETPPHVEYRGVKFKDLKAPAVIGLETVVHTLKSVCYARRAKAALVHIHAIGPAVTIPLAKLLRLKVVVTHHGPDYERRKWGWFARLVLKTGEYFAARWADEIIVISTLIRQSLKDKYGCERTHLIYNGVNPQAAATGSDYVNSLGLVPGKYVLAAGRFVEEKNFDRLIRAYASISPSGYRLVIAGDADHQTAYAKTLKKLAGEHNVLLPGMIKGAALQELYAHAGLFVLPSSHEGLPITLLEAMSHGTDVLVSDIPANVEVGLPDDCYFHYTEDCSDSLREAIEAKLRQPAGKRTYDLSRYDWNVIARKTLEVYRSAAK
jgi:glycosyltransferase involved in cell wall biosynthesis